MFPDVNHDACHYHPKKKAKRIQTACKNAVLKMQNARQKALEKCINRILRLMHRVKYTLI